MAATPFPIPVVATVGPGSQPVEADGADLNVLGMPDSMATFNMPILPEADEVRELTTAKRMLWQVLEKLDGYLRMGAETALDLSALDARNRALVDQTLGEGEVAIVFANQPVAIQESVLAGVWRLQRHNELGALVADALEVGAIPGAVARHAFAKAARRIDFNTAELIDGLQNAPSLIAELNDAIARCGSSSKPHVINLSLLPHTPEDLLWLGERLGQGTVSVLSRGYGNCRVVSTGTKNVWWVQYFNSQDLLILNTLEVTEVPSVVQAAREDLEDSRERLREILAVIE